jgi:hypothetical protein
MCSTQTASISWLSMLAPIGSFILGFISAVFAEPARQRLFRPILRLRFSKTPDCVARTPIGGGGEAIYIRVEVVNEKRRLARQCRAYLVNAEVQNDLGEFEPTIYVDSIQLAWSCRETGKERDAVDLPNGVSQYIDVLTTYKSSTSFKPQISPFPFRYQELFANTPKTFRFTVQVSGDGVDPAFITIIFSWKGQWDVFEVYQANKQSRR